MMNFVPRPTGRVAGWLGLFAVGACCGLGGCGKSQESDRQRPAKKYEVADDDRRAPSAVPGPGSGASGGPGAAAPGQMAEGGVPDGAGGLIQSPPMAAGQLETITVPDGTPAELLVFIDELGRKIESAQANLQSQPRNVAIARMQVILEALLTAADKILASKEADQAARRRAIDTKAGAMSVLSRLAPEAKWGEKVKEFGTTLAADEDPGIAVEGRAILLGIFLGELAQGRSRDYDALMTQLQSLLQLEARSSVAYEISMQAVSVLRNAGQDDKAREAFALIAAAFKDHQDPQLAREAARMAEQVAFMDNDMESKFRGAISDREGEAQVFLDAMDAMLKRPEAGSLTLEKGAQYISMLEQTSHYELARKLCSILQESFQASSDPAVKDAATQVLAMAQRRLDLLGKPLVIEATRLDGVSLDFAPYQGKPVLVAFFGAFDPRCQQEMSHLKSAYEKYHDKGFEVIGVSLDPDRDMLAQYLAEVKLPWVIVTNNKLAENLGVEMIPFFLLLDREGKVTDIYLHGPALDKRLVELFGPADAPASTDPLPTPPSATPPSATDAPATDAPADQSHNLRGPRAGNPFAGFVACALPEPTDELAPDELAPSPAETPGDSAKSPYSRVQHVVSEAAGVDETPARLPSQRKEPGGAEQSAGDQEAEEEDELAGVLEDLNPYLAPAGLPDAELITFLFDMQEKPKSIRHRPGFAEAVVEAADRLLAGQAPQKHQLIAAEAKFSTLHEMACLGNDEADQRLQAFVEAMLSDHRPTIVQHVAFFQLERRVLQADQVPLEELPALLADLLVYLKGERKLEARHLRLASAAVHAVNRLPDEAEREKYFSELGHLYAKSEDRQLARYGKKLVGSGKGQVSDWLGKSLELEGLTDQGTPFDWSSYREKVVLVAFWATWCGPCLQELPQIRSLHERHSAAGFDVVAISVDEDLEALAKYLDENTVPWTNLIGEGARTLATKYEVRGIPTMMLVDKTGQVVAVGNKVETLEPRIPLLLEMPRE